MQYLLSEEEMQEIRTAREQAARMPSLEALTNVVKYMACRMVVEPIDGQKARPHGCIHVRDPYSPEWTIDYCDRCPASGICPLPKNWSK